MLMNSRPRRLLLRFATTSLIMLLVRIAADEHDALDYGYRNLINGTVASTLLQQPRIP